MVARLARFRLGQLIALFNGPIRQKVLNFFGLFGFLTAAFLLAWYPHNLLSESPESLFFADVITTTLVFVLVLLLVFFTDRFNLHTRSFQMVASQSNKLASSILITSVLTWPFIGFIVWALTFVKLRAEIYQFSMLVIGLTLLGLFTLVTIRIFSSLSRTLFDTERRVVVRRGLATVLIIAGIPLTLYLGFVAFSADHSQAASQVSHSLRWLPPGLVFSSALDAVAGSSLEAFANLTIFAAVVALFAGVALSLMVLELRTVPHPEDSQLQQVKLGWFGVFPANPSGAIGARAMLYWLKDPRYRISLVAIPVIPFAIVTIFKFVGVSVSVLAFFPLPIVLIMIAWMTHNDVAHDATAFWLHVASGIKGWQDRLGRITPVLFFGLPLLIIGTVISAILMDDWKLLASFFALGFVALTASSAVSSISSILFPYPATRPGESPFMQPQWQGAGAGFAQTSSLVASAVLTSPIIWYIVQYNSGNELISLSSLLVGSSIYGIVLLVLGIAVGGKVFDKRATNVLMLSQIYD